MPAETGSLATPKDVPEKGSSSQSSHPGVDGPEVTKMGVGVICWCTLVNWDTLSALSRVQTS